MVANAVIDKPDGKIPRTASLDDAMLMTGFGAYNILHTLMSGLILLGVITQSLAFSYVMPAARCDLNITLQQMGWLSAIPFAAIILTSHLWGWLADTRGRKPVMHICMFCSVLLSIISSFATNVSSLAVLVFIASVFTSSSSAVIYTYIGEFNNLRHRDKMVTFGASFVGIATIILPSISWLILPLDFAYPIPILGITYRSWRLLIVACNIPFMLSIIFMIFAPESPKFLTAADRKEEALQVVKRIYAVNKFKQADTFPITSLVVETQTVHTTSTGIIGVLMSMKAQTVPLFKMPLLPWTCLTCFVQFGIFSSANGFYVWLPTILNSLANHQGGEDIRICDVIDENKKAAINSTSIDCEINTATFQQSIYIGILFCSMYLIVGFLVDSVGKKLIIITVLAGSGLCGAASNIVRNQQLARILFAVFQMCGACIGLMNAVAVDLFPTKYRAMAVCLSLMMGRLGSMIGSNFVGLLLETRYCGVTFYLTGGLLVVCALVCLSLPAKKKKSEKTVSETHRPV